MVDVDDGDEQINTTAIKYSEVNVKPGLPRVREMTGKLKKFFQGQGIAREFVICEVNVQLLLNLREI